MGDADARRDRERLADLFERALTVPPAERAGFLEHSCDDHALRAELGSLLDWHDTSPDFLEWLGRRVLPAALDAFAGDAFAAGDRVGRYEIQERLGRGGMGVVYKARDTSLDRAVALKFLPPQLSADAQARERLRREARAASALDHPHIAVVYEIGETATSEDDSDGGRLFIAMAYYDGETLRERIARGPLSPSEALDIGRAIARGLAAAHRVGIVHRDIKPANVVITTDGQVKILDFGVAMVTGSELTREGAAIGTLAYMSPEQTRGEIVDHRTDLWSLGVVLYEMIAGAHPFLADAEAAVVHRIRHDEPRPLDAERADAPAALARVVARCLAKKPERRYASAAELLAALDAVAEGQVAEPEPSIIVLPFANISSDPANEYFSDGLTEEVIAALSHVRALRVISRTSAMRFRRTDKELRTIAREAGVRYVLEGGVRKAGNELRITVRLVDAHTERPLWTRTFSGTVEGVFEFQEQIARATAEALRIHLSPAEGRLLASRPLADPRAYECYLRARYEAWRFSGEGLARAQRYIDTALSIVGDNELLYSTLGHIMATHLDAGVDPGGRSLAQVEELAQRVFALNPDSARGHLLRAFVAFYRADMRAAVIAGERAHALAPDDPDTLLLLGYVYAHVGRNVDARARWDQAMKLDPLTPLTHAVQGFLAILEGHFTDAVEPYRRCHEMDPDSPFPAVCYGWALAYARRFDEAFAVLDDAVTRFPGTAFAGWAGSLAQALRGDREGAVRALALLEAGPASGSEMFARAAAQGYALAGEKERALHWLEREIELGMLNHAYLAEHDSFLEGIRGEPRFAELMAYVSDRLDWLAQ